eukprot:scaffold1618_cov158-Ochromonas_danica.AAC.23
MVAAIKRPVPPATATRTPTPPVVTKSKMRSALFRDMLVSLQEADSCGAAEVVDEVFSYLSIPKLVGTDLYEQKPLLWWGENAYRYPCLSMIARKVLCILATSASSERLFSLAGRTITEERSRLRSDLARNLIYLRANWGSNPVEEEEENGSTIVEID